MKGLRGILGPSLLKLIAFAVVTLFLTGILVQTIGNISFAASTTYKARFSDSTGLFSGNDVRIAGVKVGQVKAVKVVDKKFAEATFTVQKSVHLLRSTHASIRYLNLVGGRYLSITEAPGDSRTLESGMTIPLSQTTPALDLTVLFNGFKPLFAALNPRDVNRLSFEIIQTLQGEGGTINELLIRTASVTNTIADKDAVIGRVISNLTTVLATVDARDNNLDQLIVQLQRFFSGLAQDRQAIGDSLVNINSLVTSVGGLIAEARPPLQPDIQHLGSVAGQLNSQSADLQNQLRTVANTINTAARTANYGSWFNFYLCQLDGQVTFQGQTVKLARVTNSDGVCTS